MLLVAVTVILASPCARLELRAELGRDLRVVRGTAACVAGDAAAVATYPRLLRSEAGLDDVSRPWHYPAGFSPADMRLWLGRRELEGEGAWVELGGEPAPREVRFETRVPERNGTFGWRAGVATLLAGWHPAFGAPGRPLPEAVIDFTVRFPPGVVGLVGAEPVGRSGPRLVRGRFRGRYLPLLAARELDVRTTGAWVLVRPVPPPGLRDVTAHRDELALAELRSTLELGDRHAGTSALPRRPLLVVVGPLRARLAELFDGGVFISDRAFHVPSLELFRRFHRLAIWRAQLAALALPLARAREHDLAPALVADAVACALRQALGAARYGSTAYAPELLEPIAVIPEIDNLLFAPQIPFLDAYFDAVDERRPGPPDVRHFEHALPRGKLLYEKLVDLVGAGQALAVTRAYLLGSEPYLSAVSRLAGAQARAALEAWLAPPPRIGYRLARVEASADHTEVTVEAFGPDFARAREPVQVALTDANGDRHEGARAGPGVVTFRAAGPPQVVELDPEVRLADSEHAPGLAPRFDNRDPPRWRFLLNDVTGLVAVTNRQLTTSADFSLRRLHDLRYRFDLRGLYSPESYQLGAATSYGFGAEVTPLRLAHRVGIGAAAERLRVERGIGEPGYELSLTASYVYDTRPSPYLAYEGTGVSARVTAALDFDDAGRRHRHAHVSASLLELWPLDSYHALVSRVRGDWLTGEAPAQQALRLGGRYTAGRGYEPDEARGTRRVVASLEDRHALSVGTRTDLFGLLVVTGVEGALYADAVYLPVERPGCDRTLFFDVGYGLRFLVDVLAVSPSSLALDVGVPLTRCEDERQRPPVTIYLSFVQSFLVF